MASISITVPDAIAARVTADMCYYNGYQQKVPDPNNPGQLIDNPITPGQFIKNCIKNYVLQCCRAYEAQKAAEDARVAAITAADTDILLGD